jgi:hypothetical protein
MQKPLAAIFTAAICAGTAFAYSSASYKRKGLLAQWDAIDNAGTGVHDPDATVWKDIAPKGPGAVSYDLTLNATYGSWGGGNYLNVNSGPAAWGSRNAPAYATIEVVFRATMTDTRYIHYLFVSGIDNVRQVTFSKDSKNLYFDANNASRPCLSATSFADSKDHSYAAIYNGDALARIHDAGNLVTNPPTATVNNSPSKGRVIIGHSNTSQTYYSFKGRVYAIRLYDHVLSAGEIAEHRAIDEARFFAAEAPAFVVEGAPYNYGANAVQPAYGTTNFAAGATMTFTAPATAPNPGNSASVTCTGWKIYTLDAATGNWVFDSTDPSKSGSGTTCSYTRPADAPVEKLVWQWSGWRIVNLEPEENVAAAYADCGDGDIIRLTTGDYVMIGRITINNDVSIIGDGPDASLIDCATAGGRPFTISDGRVRIEGVRIFNGPEVASYNGGGIYMSCGIVADCTISNCIGKISSGGAGGIYMTGGIVTNCLITRCESKLTGSGYPQGSGIALHGGLVTDCRFIANRSTGWQNGVGIYIDKGICERCVFTGHTQGTPIYNAGGTVRNCLVYGNRTGTSSFDGCKRFGGVYQSSGSLYNCTVVGNRSGKGVGGLRAEGGNVINNIVWNNVSDDGTTVGYYFAGSGAFHTNLLDTATDAGIGNFSSNPGFVDAEHHDYHLGLTSLAVNSGAPLAGVRCDLDGAVRPFGPAPEIGCYEYTTVAAELTCIIRAFQTEYCEGEAFSLTSVVDGPDLAGLQYAWSLDGVAYASGVASSGCDFPGTLEPGRHTILLTVSNGSGDNASNSVVISILPLTTYVAETGDDEANFPYHTPGLPAATFSAALSAVWKSSTTTSHVFLAEGTYALGNPVSLSLPVKIAGAGAQTTTLDCTGIAGRAFYLNHKDAEVRDLTVAHARPSTSGTPGGAFYLVNGTVDSCIITNCAGYTMSGGAIYMTGGTLRDSVVTRCQILRTGSGYTHGEGALVSGGLVSGCSFVANYPEGRYSNGIGLEMTEGNAVVENCVFTGHKATPLMFASGTVRNCLIYGNESTTSADNSNYRKTGGVYMSGGTLYNCTIVTNRNASSTKGSAGLRMAGGRAVNNVIWGNPSEDGSAGVTIASGSTFTTNLVDATISSAGTEVGTVVSPSSPFKRPAARDYRLKMGSLAVGIGDNVIWSSVANPTDLDGNPRIIPRRGAVDAGCYELQKPGFTTLFLQ